MSNRSRGETNIEAKYEIEALQQHLSKIEINNLDKILKFMEELKNK
jgi:hypothetical protein